MISCNGLGSWNRTHLHGGLQLGGLHSRATIATDLELYSRAWRLTPSGLAASDNTFGIWNCIHLHESLHLKILRGLRLLAKDLGCWCLFCLRCQINQIRILFPLCQVFDFGIAGFAPCKHLRFPGRARKPLLKQLSYFETRNQNKLLYGMIGMNINSN